MPENRNARFEKLTRDNPESTKICAGGYVFTAQQMEEEIEMDSEIGKRLKSIEHYLDYY